MMPIFTIRRSGNSLVLPIASRMARDLDLKEGDRVLASIQKLRPVLEMAGKLKGRATADELNALTNEGEDLG